MTFRIHFLNTDIEQPWINTLDHTSCPPPPTTTTTIRFSSVFQMWTNYYPPSTDWHNNLAFKLCSCSSMFYWCSPIRGFASTLRSGQPFQWCWRRSISGRVPPERCRSGRRGIPGQPVIAWRPPSSVQAGVGRVQGMVPKKTERGVGRATVPGVGEGKRQPVRCTSLQRKALSCSFLSRSVTHRHCMQSGRWHTDIACDQVSNTQTLHVIRSVTHIHYMWSGQ